MKREDLKKVNKKKGTIHLYGPDDWDLDVEEVEEFLNMTAPIYRRLLILETLKSAVKTTLRNDKALKKFPDPFVCDYINTIGPSRLDLKEWDDSDEAAKEFLIGWLFGEINCRNIKRSFKY